MIFTKRFISDNKAAKKHFLMSRKSSTSRFEFQTVTDDLSCEQLFPLESRTPGTQVLVYVPSLRGDVAHEGFKPTVLSKDALVKESLGALLQGESSPYPVNHHSAFKFMVEHSKGGLTLFALHLRMKL